MPRYEIKGSDGGLSVNILHLTIPTGRRFFPYERLRVSLTQTFNYMLFLEVLSFWFRGTPVIHFLKESLST